MYNDGAPCRSEDPLPSPWHHTWEVQVKLNGDPVRTKGVLKPRSISSLAMRLLDQVPGQSPSSKTARTSTPGWTSCMTSGGSSQAKDQLSSFRAEAQVLVDGSDHLKLCIQMYRSALNRNPRKPQSLVDVQLCLRHRATSKTTHKRRLLLLQPLPDMSTPPLASGCPSGNLSEHTTRQTCHLDGILGALKIAWLHSIISWTPTREAQPPESSALARQPAHESSCFRSARHVAVVYVAG